MGGESSHCVLTGHSGMYNSRMLDDLRQMKVGDLFAVHTLSEELVYEVEDISVVLPEDVGSLSIVPGRGFVHAAHVHALRGERPSAVGDGSPHRQAA